MDHTLFDRVNDRVISLHREGAIHVRRGYKLDTATSALCSNHMIEEAVELQAEVLHGTYSSQIDEAADLLCVFLHLLWINGIPTSHVAEKALQKLADNFTTDPAAVTTNTPGFTRRNRDDQK